jgi:hypothetical protein
MATFAATEASRELVIPSGWLTPGRGLHWFTLELNLSNSGTYSGLSRLHGGQKCPS